MIVISRSESTDAQKWCAKINNVAQFRQCSIMFPGNMASYDPCSRGTWCKTRNTINLHRFFWSDCSNRQINMYSMLLPHGWRHKFVAFISWYNKTFGPRATLHNFGALFFNVVLGRSQYLYKKAPDSTLTILMGLRSMPARPWPFKNGGSSSTNSISISSSAKHHNKQILLKNIKLVSHGTIVLDKYICLQLLEKKCQSATIFLPFDPYVLFNRSASVVLTEDVDRRQCSLTCNV